LPVVFLAGALQFDGAYAQAPAPFICMYGHSDDAGVTDAFRRIIPPFTVIEGTSADAAFVKELRDAGRIYAAHVTNPTSATTDALVAEWRAPFDNDLAGSLPGGYDAIAIDELRANPNGSKQSNRVCAALAELRRLYPNKQIYVAATWHLGRHAATYSDQLHAANRYVDMLMLEAYLRETRPSYGYFAKWADNLKAVSPDLLHKTVYGLGIAQNGFVFDEGADVGFWGHLDEQFNSIRTDADASKMPGIMFWVYYRSETALTPDYVARLVNHYYVRKRTDHFGDGKAEQLVSNPRFETLNGWSPEAGKSGAVQLFGYESIPNLQNDHDAHGQSSHGRNGLRMIRGSTPNRASFEVGRIDRSKVYTVSAWVMADEPDRRAGLRIIGPDDTVIASRQTDLAGRGTRWNEWTRIAFNFRPTSPAIRIELHDGQASPGTVLYWDFVELEAAYPDE